MLDIILHSITPLVPISPAAIEEIGCHISQDVRNHANDRLSSLTKKRKTSFTTNRNREFK